MSMPTAPRCPPPGLAAFSMIAMSGRAVEPLDPAGSGTYSTGT